MSPAPGSRYTYRHADLNALMLYPWPTTLPINITGGVVGIHKGLTWRQYLGVLGEYWETTRRYPRHSVQIDHSRLTVREQVYMGQLWGLAVRAMVERGYLNPYTGALTPPVPFAVPPPEFG